MKNKLLLASIVVGLTSLPSIASEKSYLELSIEQNVCYELLDTADVKAMQQVEHQNLYMSYKDMADVSYSDIDNATKKIYKQKILEVPHKPSELQQAAYTAYKNTGCESLI